MLHDLMDMGWNLGFKDYGDSILFAAFRLAHLAAVLGEAW